MRPGSPVEGRTILVHAEQGFGDAIQCMRHLPMLADPGADVIAEVRRELAPLVFSLRRMITVPPWDSPPPPADYQCPMMSLPYFFGTTIETIPADIPYLRAVPSREAAWRSALGEPRRRRVGVAWGGNPDHVNNDQRPVPVDVLMPLLRRPDIEWHVLQADTPPSDRSALGHLDHVFDHGGGFRDFADTAALTMAMDAVVTVDTSVAHLTGALGRRIILMRPFSADWRWMLDRTDSPWYPSATLVRQRIPGDWKDVIARVDAML